MREGKTMSMTRKMTTRTKMPSERAGLVELISMMMKTSPTQRASAPA